MSSDDEEPAHEFMVSSILSSVGVPEAAVKTESPDYELGYLRAQPSSLGFCKKGTVETVKLWEADSNPAVPRHHPQLYLHLKKLFGDHKVYVGDELKPDALLKFVKELHEDVDEPAFRRAINLLLWVPLDCDNKGEMVLQQFVYPPFSTLFFSMNPDGYLADRFWNSPVVVEAKQRPSDAWAKSIVATKPDAASTREIVSALNVMMGQLEIKPSETTTGGHILNVHDIGKSVLTTACAAQTLFELGMKSEEIYVPFMLATGYKVQLCVVGIGNGTPVPVSVLPHVYDIRIPAERNEVFALLAVFLATQHRQTRGFQVKKGPKYEKMLADGGGDSGGEESTAVQIIQQSSKKQKRSNDGKNTTQSSSSANTSSLAGSQELAKLAVASVGVASLIPWSSHLNPWSSRSQVVALNLDTFFGGESSKTSVLQEEQSPFYFRARLGANQLFCKVYCQGDENAPSPEVIKDEIHMLELANEAEVPAPKVWSKLSKPSLTVHGQAFSVIVLDLVEGHEVLLGDITHYAYALVVAVQQLHDCGILHCDIKPTNICWMPTKRQVNLLDFGHAQLIDSAEGYRTTKGFEAPEIISGEAHSTASDAFGVGATILAEMGHLKMGNNHWLRHVAHSLTAHDIKARFELGQAESMLKTALSPTLIRPQANVRLVETM